MTNLYGSGMVLTIEANKENIPPGYGFSTKLQEPIVLPETQSIRNLEEHTESTSPISRPSPSMSQISDTSCQDSSIINTSADEADDDMETTSRKEKSLGLLCQRFLIAMNEETRSSASKEVHLETVARKMNVEKRRIYDIVNVMEALDAMQKTNKSYYQWQGLEELPKLMHDLQIEAIEEGLPDRVLRVEQAMCSFTELSSPSGKKPLSKAVVGSFVTTPTASDPSTSKCDSSITTGADNRRSRVDNRDRQGRNSLAQLCRRFLMVLLSNPKNVRKVSLDVASTVLIKDPETEGFEPPSRSRCRRLYDIANVLVALGLIKKVHYLFGTKKIPLFVYCGPEPDTGAVFDVYASVERLLSSQQNTPTTPTIRAATDKIVQQLAGFGKRSHSDATAESSKMAKIRAQQMPPPASPKLSAKSTNPLMMFAEIAAGERMRLDALARFSSMPNPLLPSTSTPIPAAKIGNDGMSCIQFPNGIPISPLGDGRDRKPLSFESPFAYIENRFLPFSMPNPIRPACAPLPFAKRSPSKESMKHSMSNILGVSNKSNIPSFDHTNTSPFQVVKKGESREK